MKYFNLYKKGRYGWFHVTSYKSNNLHEAITYYTNEWNIKIGSNIGNYKVSGL